MNDFRFALKDVVITDIRTSGDSYDWGGCPTCGYGKIYTTYLAITYYDKETKTGKELCFEVKDSSLSISEIIIFFARLDRKRSTLQDVINFIHECGLK